MTTAADASAGARSDDGLRFTPVIVAGVPRSGTHFLHSLICTSERTNPFTQEYHYFFFLLDAYMRALRVHDAAASAGFSDKTAFSRHHFALMKSTLCEAWEYLERPEMLVMKHCGLTPYLPVLARQFQTMKFVVILRDARDTIASEVRAARIRHRDQALIPEELIRLSINRYNICYGSVAKSAALLGDRLHCIRYEHLVRGQGMESLETFLGVDDIDENKLWRRATFDIGRFEHFIMHSKLWGKPISSENIGRYSSTLPSEVSERIFRETRQVMEGFEVLHETGNSDGAETEPRLCT